MAEKKETPTPPPPDAGSELRRTLIKRLAVAAILVAVLLGVLAFFDYLSTSEEPEAPVYTKPVPVPPKKEVTQPVTPAESLPEPPKPEGAAPEKPAEAPPKAEAPAKPGEAPKPEAPAKPEVQPKPEVPVPPAPAAKPEIRPEAKALPKPVTPHPLPPAGKPTPPAEGTAGPAMKAPAEVPAPALVPPRPQPQPPAPAPQPQPLRLFSGYVLQAGVFTSVQRAEELHAQLTLNGIPSTLEARVQVGPFKTREEALAAREKLKALGIAAVLIPPKPAGQ